MHKQAIVIYFLQVIAKKLNRIYYLYFYTHFYIHILRHGSILTCALVRPKWEAISSRSAGDKYFWYKNRVSNSKIWWFVNAVLDFRFFFEFCLVEKDNWLGSNSKNVKILTINIILYDIFIQFFVLVSYYIYFLFNFIKGV